MNSPELAQLEMLAQVDGLVDRLRQWADGKSDWEPATEARALLRRLLARVEVLRVRLETPLVVATFGGTGTGKSALVNALVGQDVTASGRQRPTTTQPILITHPETPLELLAIPLDDVRVVRVDMPVLRDVLLLDCPDPDTTEDETPGSNLARLHRLLPYCDVLIYVSTQQKYRSARVSDELAAAATGCRLVFVQTFAELDSDIRDDWRRQLAPRYAVPEVFFVDSLRALREQQAGQKPSGDFGRLLDLLATELAASHRTRIRRANLVDLVHAALERCRAQFEADWPAVEALERSLAEQQRLLAKRMSQRLEDELLASRNLWERRLVSAVTEMWGISPFSSALRFYNGLGTWIASWSLARARTTAQVALIGAAQGARWLASRSEEAQADQQIERLSSLGLDEDLVRQTQFVVAGYVRSARLDSVLLEAAEPDSLRRRAARVEDDFLFDARRQIDAVIHDLARRHSGVLARYGYEAALLVLAGYVVGRPAWNFFIAHPFLGAPLISTDFYIHGGIFLVLWGGLLVMMFARRLRRGLQKRITQLAQELAAHRFGASLFPQLEVACRDARTARDRLAALAQQTAHLRRQIAVSSSLGAPLPAPNVMTSPETIPLSLAPPA